MYVVRGYSKNKNEIKEVIKDNMKQNRLENIKFEISQSKDELEYRVINVEVQDKYTVHHHQMQLPYNAFVSDLEQIMALITKQLKIMALKPIKEKVHLNWYKKEEHNIEHNIEHNQVYHNKTILDL